MLRTTIAIATLMMSSSAFAQLSYAPKRSGEGLNPALNENATVPGPDVGVPSNGTNDAKSGSTRSDGGTATGGPVGGPMTGGGGR